MRCKISPEAGRGISERSLGWLVVVVASLCSDPPTLFFRFRNSQVEHRQFPLVVTATETRDMISFFVVSPSMLLCLFVSLLNPLA